MDGKVTGIEVRGVESGGDDNYIRGSIIITDIVSTAAVVVEI